MENDVPMDKVLIVSHFFAQCRHFRSTRINGLARYLPQQGWSPVVLTSAVAPEVTGEFTSVEVRYEDYLKQWKERLGLKADQPLKEQVEEGREGKRNLADRALTTWERVYGFPDPTLSWVGPAVEAGKKLMADEDIKAIISSSGPGASHIVASKLKAERDVPWVADFRDLWAWDHNDVRSPVRRLMNEKLERDTLRSADVLTTVSDPLAEKLMKIHHRDRVITIPNGFDPVDMPSQAVDLDRKFSINYTGKVYRKGMDPAPLFDVLRNLTAEGTIDREEVEVNFYGDRNPWFMHEIEERGLADIVKVHGTVPRRESLDIQKRSQVLLILAWDNKKEKGVYTGKIFDYLAAKRPILSIGSSEDVISKLLTSTGTGLIATNDQELQRILVNSYKEYKTEGSVRYKGDMPRVMDYSHANMAKRFAELLRP
jgi:hypothetical protein